MSPWSVCGASPSRLLGGRGAGTELGGSYLSGSLLQPQAPGTFSLPTLGTQLVLLAADGGQSAHLGSDGARPATGELAICPPMLGSSQRLLNRDHHAVYFEVHLNRHAAVTRCLLVL